MSYIENKDKVVYDAIQKEFQRQGSNIKLIASGSFVSQTVMETQGSVLMNKYTEDCPRRRYYGGCEYVSVTEFITIERARTLLGAEHVNVQSHSDSQVSMAVYLVALEMGDTVLGMNLSRGGYLAYGAAVDFSSKFYRFVGYGVDQENELINCDGVRCLAIEHQPKLIVASTSAYSKTIDFKRFKEITDEVGTKLMVDMVHIAGLIAAGLHPNPVGYADFVTTTTHKTLRGPCSDMILCRGEYKKDIDKTIFPSVQGGPLEHVVAAEAVAFGEALNDDFKDYQNQVIKNAQALAQTLIEGGFRVISGGADNRLITANVKDSINMTGKLAEETFDKVGITCNKNTVPFGKEKPFMISGVRLGAPIATTRSLDEFAFVEVTKIISLALNNHDNGTKLNETKERVHALASKCPSYN